jgi:hypothetical protein
MTHGCDALVYSNWCSLLQARKKKRCRWFTTKVRLWLDCNFNTEVHLRPTFKANSSKYENLSVVVPDKWFTQILEPFFETRFDHSAGFPSDSSLGTQYSSHPVTFVPLSMYPSANPPTRLLTYPPNHPPILIRNLLSPHSFIYPRYALFLPATLVSVHIQTHTHTSTHFPSIHTSHTYCDLLHCIYNHRYSQSSIVPFHLYLFTSLTNKKFFVSINVGEKLKQMNLVLRQIILYSLIMRYISDHRLLITVCVWILLWTPALTWGLLELTGNFSCLINCPAVPFIMNLPTEIVFSDNRQPVIVT